MTVPTPQQPRRRGRTGRRPQGMPAGHPVSLPSPGAGATFGDPGLMVELGAVREQLALIPAEQRDEARRILQSAARQLRALA